MTTNFSQLKTKFKIIPIGLFFVFAFFATQSVKAQYCTAIDTTTNTSNECITNVSMAELNHSSGNDNYADFTQFGTRLERGVTYVMTITAGGGAYTGDQAGVYIDWNNNQSFTDAGEYFAATPNDANHQSYTVTITVPTTAAIANTRMRVRLIDSASHDTMSPCGNSTWGNIEDYTVNVIAPINMECNGSWAIQPTTSPVRVGSTNQVILVYAIRTFGSLAAAQLTNISLGLNGTIPGDISAVKAYFTDTSTTFSTAHQFGSTLNNPGATFSISGSQALSLGFNYLWIVYDISPTATIGDSVDAVVNSAVVAGTVVTPLQSNPTGSRLIRTGLSGPYTVGTGGNYPSLYAAFYDANLLGLSGDTRFTILNALSEANTPILSQMPFGADHNITIKPAAGVTTTITTTSGNEAFVINGCNNVTIDGSNTENGTTRNLSIVNSGTGTYSNGIAAISATNFTLKNTNVSNSSNIRTYNVLLDNCTNANISGNNLNTALVGLYVQDGCSNLNIQKNIIGAGASSNKLSLYGIIFLPGTATNSCNGYTIADNNIYGIATNSSVVQNDSLIAVCITDGINGNIVRNTIRNITSTAASSTQAAAIGIRLTSNTPARNLNTTIANNMISDITTQSNSPEGINIGSVSGINVINNTINFNTASGGNYSACLFIDQICNNLNVVNNIFNTTSNCSLTSYGIFIYRMPNNSYSFSGTFTQLDYNHYNLVSTGLNLFGGVIANNISSSCVSFPEWRTASGGDLNSTTGAVSFLSTNDLHLDGPSLSYNYLQAPIFTSVTTDFDNTTRTGTSTFKGADNVTPVIALTSDLNAINSHYCSGESVSFTFAASTSFDDGIDRPNNNGLVYTWYHNNNVIPDAGTNTYTISSLTDADAGTYQAKAAFFSAYTNTSTRTLNSTTPITITTDLPTQSYACQGGNALNLSVQAAGTITGYQWQRENPTTKKIENIAGQTTANLLYPVAKAEDAQGRYRVVVSGPGYCGDPTVTSSWTNVTVSIPLSNAVLTPNTPTIDGCQGNDIAVTANADGTVLGYQWQKYANSTYVDIDPGDFPTARSKTFVLPGARTFDSGIYRCVITGSDACTPTTIATNDVTINVRALASILVNPQHQHICYGSEFELDAQADGTVVSYQWQRNEQDISTDQNPTANTPVFYIANSDFANSGRYRCKILVKDCENINGRYIYTDNALVYVYDQTRLVNYTANVSAKIGEDAVFEVKARVVGAPDDYRPDVQWYRGNIKLTDDGRISGSAASIMTIKNITNADLGNNYRVVVTGLCGAIEEDNISLISPNVTITGQPQNATVCTGKDASFAVTAVPNQGGSSISYQWYKGNNVIADNDKYQGTTTNNLTVKNVAATDADSYRCKLVVEPGDISYFTNTAALAVNESPEITQEPASTTLKVGEALTLSFEVNTHNDPNVTVQWYKDGNAIANANSSNYQIAAVATSDNGQYYCEITTSCGSVKTKTISVTVTENSQNPTAVTEDIISSTISSSPNPFDTKTTISFNLAKAANVEVYISSVLGNRIAQLYSGSMTEGPQSFDFNPNAYNLSDGTYYYTIKVNGQIKTGTIVYIK